MRKLVAAALLMAASRAALGEGLTLGAGVEYTSGKYGSPEKTDTLFVPFYGKYETGPWTLRLTVPWLQITGPGNVVGVGGDRIVLPGGAGPRRTESGLGDITASAFYNVISERTAPIGVDLGAKVKFGTADENKGLGTGQNDYSVQADLFKPLGGKFSAFGSLGYRWYGDPPGVTLRDVWYFSIGGSYRATDTLSAGLAYDYRPSITPTGGEISELTLFFSQRVSREMRLQPYLVVGFGKASPDYGAGIQASYAF